VKITGRFHSATLTPGSDEAEIFLNGGAFYGKADWAKDTAMDVLHCADGVDSTNQTDYWVIRMCST
jgi:hypothetical protein